MNYSEDQTSNAYRGQGLQNSPRWKGFVHWGGYTGTIIPLAYVLLFTVAGLLRQGYSARSQAISDLGVGPMAWLLNIPTVVLGLVIIALAIAFFQATPDLLSTTQRWISAVFIGLPGIGFLAAGIFTEAPATVMVHWLVGALLALYFPILTFLVTGLVLIRHQPWRRFAVYSLVASLVTITAAAFMQAAFTPGSALNSLQIAGLAERVNLVEILAWYVVMGWRLARNRGDSVRTLT